MSWHKSSEELPEPKTIVLAYDRGQYDLVSYCPESYALNHWWVDACSATTSRAPEYWQPLPAEPPS